MDDHQLIARIANGDKAAIQVIFARHHRRLFRYVERLVGNEATAEELVNEVLLEVWRSAGRFEGRSKVSTWIMRIAHNKAVSSIRKKREVALGDDDANSLVDTTDSPEVAVQKSDKSDALRVAIERLSEDHRAVIDLIYYHELPIGEVADVLNIPVNTVKTRVLRARRNLTQHLRDLGIDRGWP